MRAVIAFITGFLLLLTGFVAWLFLTPWGAKTVIRELSRRTLGARTVSWASLSGSLSGGIKVSQLEVRVIPYLVESSFLRVQSVSVRFSRFSMDGFDIDIINARLFYPQDDPIIFNAHLGGRELSGNIYTSGLDLGNVREVLTQFFEVPPFKGVLSGIDLFISGSLDQPKVRGQLFIDRIWQNDFVLQGVSARADLHFIRGRPRWETRGRLYLDSGSLRSPVALVELQPSLLTFTGVPSRPELDIHASSRIARTLINITVKGTRQNPEVILSSDPVYPKEQLLLMLATGKRWSGIVDGASDKAKLSPALTSNFVDYLLFGGDRVKIIRAIGLSDISFRADEKKQGVTFSKDVTDRLGVEYGLDVGNNTQRQRELTQRLEGEYQLTDHFLLGVQKEVKPAREGSRSNAVNVPDAGMAVSSQDLPDDRVFLKYRSSF